MWITAEVVGKVLAEHGYDILVDYGTDDNPPIVKRGKVLLVPGQDESTLKAAMVQQLADFNAKDDADSKDAKTLDFISMVDAIALGPVDLKSVEIDPVIKPPVLGPTL